MTWKRLFRSKMKDEDWMLDTAEVWAIALTDLKITGKEMRAAQRKSMALEWPPTAPADFLKLSRVEVAGNYPEMHTAYLQAAQGEYKHEVILETAKRVGEWQIKTQPESVSYKAWVLEYPIVCSEHSQGERFSVPVSHQVEYEHTAMASDSAMSGNVDDFFANFGSKKGEAV